jgi:uncharacterized protein YggE
MMNRLFSKKTMGLSALVLVMLLALTGCAALGAVPTAAPGSAQLPEPVNSITVNGIGRANGAPDVAYVQLGVDISNPDIGQAVGEANQTMDAVMEALKGMGIADEDLQTTGFNVWTEDVYDQTTGQSTGQKLYHVSNQLQVVVRDLSSIEDLLDAALAAGANNVNGLSFSINDTTALAGDARAKAVADAQARAEDLAAQMGVTLGKPISATEATSSDPMPVVQAAFGMGGGGGVPISQGQLSVVVQVSMTYSITQ